MMNAVIFRASIITGFINSLYQNTSYMNPLDRPIIYLANRQTINT